VDGRHRDAGSNTLEHALLTTLIAAAIIGVGTLGHSFITRSLGGISHPNSPLHGVTAPVTPLGPEPQRVTCLTTSPPMIYSPSPDNVPAACP